MIINENLEEQISQLEQYLISNNYNDNAETINKIKNDLSNENKQQLALKRLIAMCNPKYLGDLLIKEFNNAYEWWNFLGNISKNAKRTLNSIMHK